MRFLFLPLSLLFLVLAASGCTGPASFCEQAKATHVVQAVNGHDITIENGTLVLHTSESEVSLRDATGCHAMDAGSILAGDRLAHDADEIAESYPMQAWPDHVVIVR